MHHVEFEQLCDMADVKKLHVGLTVGSRVRDAGAGPFRDLQAITLHDPLGHGAAEQPIYRSIDVAARRLLEAIT